MRVFVDGLVFFRQRRGGISRTYQEVLPRIDTMDSTVEFILYLRRKLRDGALPMASGIHQLHERSIYPWRLFFGKKRVQDYFLQEAYVKAQPDIFHSTYFTYPQEIRSRFVVSIYDMIDDIYAPIRNRRSNWIVVEQKQHCMQIADLIVSNSHYTTRDIVKYGRVRDNKIVTIHLGVGLEFRPIEEASHKEQFRTKHGLSRPFFLFVGGRRYNKNFMGLFRAYAASKLKEEVDLVLVGDDDEFPQEEWKFISSRVHPTRIKCLKVINNEDLVLAYNTALALVFPSLYEGFGLPILEAMACGTPVLTSNTCSMPEVAGDAALYFNPHDPEDIRNALETIVQPGVARSLIDKGKARASLFTWEETARKTLEAYRRLV